MELGFPSKCGMKFAIKSNDMRSATLGAPEDDPDASATIVLLDGMDPLSGRDILNLGRGLDCAGTNCNPSG